MKRPKKAEVELHRIPTYRIETVYTCPHCLNFIRESGGLSTLALRIRCPVCHEPVDLIWREEV